MTPERPSGVDEIVWQSLPVDIQHELSAAAANTASHDLADSTETANDKHVHSPNTHTSRKRAAEKHVQSVACQKKKKQAKLSFEATADTAAVVEPSDSSNSSPLYIDTAFAPGPSSIDGYSYSGDSSNSSGSAGAGARARPSEAVTRQWNRRHDPELLDEEEEACWSW